jgi:hypothetical protein
MMERMSTHEPESDPIVQPRRNIWPVSLFLGLIVLLWLILRADQANVKIDGRYPESLNNLKLIVLSSHNYASEHEGVLPPHALVGPDETEHFGWAVPLLPYVEAQPVYDGLHLDKPWNDPVNRAPAGVSLRWFVNPRLDAPREEDGFALQHYAANSQVFRPDKTWTLEEISTRDGLTNTIFFGEIANHFQPWAAPGSLRDPAKGFGNGPDQFGIPGSGPIAFAFGDGSARAINRDIDPQVLKAWATPDGGEVIPE